MLDEQTLSINFGQGIDTKTDPKLVVSSKLTALQNGVFTSAKRVSKRNGYDAMTLNVVGGGTLSSPTMCKAYRDELITASTWTILNSPGQRLFSYSQALTKWVDRGKYLSIATSKTPISSPEVGNGSQTGAFNSSVAVNSNIALYTYDTLTSGAPSASYAVAVDQQTGSHIMSDTQISGANGYARTVVLGATNLGVLYLGAASQLMCQRLVTTSSPTFAAAVTIGTMSPTMFDVLGTSTGAVVAYGSAGTSIVLAKLDASGNLGTTATIAAAGKAGVISLSQDSSGNIWVFWVDTTTPSSEPIYYAIYSSTLTVVLAKTTITTGVNGVSQLAAIGTTTSQTIWYSTEASGSTYVIPTTSGYSVTNTGTVGSLGTLLYNHEIYSKPIAVNGRNYIAMMFLSQEQSTGYLVDMADQLPVAKFLPLEAEGVNAGGINLAVRYSGFCSVPTLLSSTQILLPAGFQVMLQTAPVGSGLNGLLTTVSSVQMGICGMTFDFSHIDAYQSVTHGDSLILNGGFLSHYDGASVSELGFHVAPDGVSAVPSTTGGNIPTGNYVYYVTFEWTDANGNLHQSAPSTGLQVIISSGTTNSVQVSAQIPLTAKPLTTVKMVLWRTKASGTIAYRIDSYNVNPRQSGGILTFDVDGATDSTIGNYPTLYTEGGAILENLAPPAAMILWTNNGRCFCVDSENPKTNVEYSKTISKGTGTSFSTGQLEIVVDSKLGAITGASPMDEKTVLLKEQGLVVFIGDGANDAGTGSTFSNTQIIPSEVGCTNSKSVALISAGIIFRSLSGIYLLSRGTSVQYLGADAEAYNSQDIRAVTLVPGKSQLRILTSSGSSLVYDYVFNQWSTFTNHAGVSSDVWNGVYIYVRSDGNIYKENSSTFLDGGSSYQLSATTSWIKASQIQGFERVRRIAMLGDFQGAAGHGVQISAAYDWSTSFSAPIAYSFTGANAAFQYRERLPQQKCNALQLQIQEVTTGVSGEFVDFSDLGLEIGAKRGLNKLPAAASVG